MISLWTEETHDNLTVIGIASEIRTHKFTVVTARIVIMYLKLIFYIIIILPQSAVKYIIIIVVVRYGCLLS